MCGCVCELRAHVRDAIQVTLNFEQHDKHVTPLLYVKILESPIYDSSALTRIVLRVAQPLHKTNPNFFDGLIFVYHSFYSVLIERFTWIVQEKKIPEN